MIGKTITNLKEPTLQLDATTKFYVDNKCANISATAAHDVAATLVTRDDRKFAEINDALVVIRTALADADHRLANYDDRFTHFADEANAYVHAQIAAIVPPAIPHYVKNNVGIVLPIANGNTKNGYVVTASTNTDNAYNVFSITIREWVSAGINRDFWIQIKLPGPIIIWQISLRRKHGNAGQLTTLTLKGSLEVTFGKI